MPSRRFPSFRFRFRFRFDSRLVQINIMFLNRSILDVLRSSRRNWSGGPHRNTPLHTVTQHHTPPHTITHHHTQHTTQRTLERTSSTFQEPSENLRRTFWESSEILERTCRDPSGNLQRTFTVENPQKTFREPSGNFLGLGLLEHGVGQSESKLREVLVPVR